MRRLYGGLEWLLWSAGIALLASSSLVIVSAAHADTEQLAQCNKYCLDTYSQGTPNYMYCVQYCYAKYSVTCYKDCNNCGGIKSLINTTGNACGGLNQQCTDWCRCSCGDQDHLGYRICGCGVGTYSNPPPRW